MLAFHIYPLPHGTEYGPSDLDTAEKVIALFDACQILEAVIEADGWKFLCDQFGLRTLFQLDLKSGWHDCELLSDYIMDLQTEAGFCEFLGERWMSLYRYTFDHQSSQFLFVYANGGRINAEFDTAFDTDNSKELDDPDYEEYHAIAYCDLETQKLFEVNYHNLPIEVWDKETRVI